MTGVELTPREMIEKLVSFDTTSRKSNLDLIEFVENYLASWGIESDLIFNSSKSKANLFATIGPEVDDGVVLSGHTDVVPVDGQDWETDPFKLCERDGRLYGRGTADMKSFIAVALSLTPLMIQHQLIRPIHFALSYDEEVGCLGVDSLIAHLSQLSKRPQAVIVGEPTEMSVVNAHKGCYSYITNVEGLEAHSSQTQLGVNSVFYAAELVNYLQNLGEELKESNLNERFTPPYTTVHVGVMHGGTAQNIIPKTTTFSWEFRVVPGHDPDELKTRFDLFAEKNVLPRMLATNPESKIVTETRAQIMPLVPQDGSPAETLVLALVGSNQRYAVSYGTEGGFFQESGIPTVICGPGNIREAHKPNEYIETSQVEICKAFIEKLCKHLS